MSAWLAEVEGLPGVVAAVVADDVPVDGVTVVEVHAEGPSNGRRPGRRRRRAGARPAVRGGGHRRPGRDRRPARLGHRPAAGGGRHPRGGHAALPDDRIGGGAAEGDRHERAVAGGHLRALVLVFQDGHLAGLLGFDARLARPADAGDRLPVRLRSVDGLRGVPARASARRGRPATTTGRWPRGCSGRAASSPPRRCSWSSCSPGSRRARWWPSSSWGSAWLWPWWSTPPWCGRCWCPRP